MSAHEIPAPHGGTVHVPALADEDDCPHASLDEPERLATAYARDGYVVVRGLLPGDACERARRAYLEDVRPDGGFFYRQASARPEKHVFTEQGHVLNSLLNVQDIESSRCGGFRRASLELLTHRHLQEAAACLLREPAKLVQSMFFEGNPATWAHQDTYYLDAAELGRMTAAWVAVEDIHPGAGRFFVYPRSHRVELPPNSGAFNIASRHERYKELVLQVVRERGLECHAPALRQGDVLFWSSRTIHGSLATTCPERSRCSFTAHLIPESLDLLQWQTRVVPLRLEEVNGMRVHHPKDQDLWRHRAVAWAASRFPGPFFAAKRLAVRIMTR